MKKYREAQAGKSERPFFEVDEGTEAALQYHDKNPFIGACRSEREVRMECLSAWKSIK